MSWGSTAQVHDYKYFRVSLFQLSEWQEAFPGVPVITELDKMRVWLDANPNRRKKNYQRFIVNWLCKVHGRLLEAQVSANVKREQERADATVGLWSGYK